MCPGLKGEIYRAEASEWTGPFTFSAQELFPGCIDPCVEDSNVYRVPEPPAMKEKHIYANVGSFHALFHGRTHKYMGKGNGQMPEWSGRHAFSNDTAGKTWYMSPYAAFGSRVEWRSGTPNATRDPKAA